MKQIKTNAQRIADKNRIKYESLEYGTGEALSGNEVALLLGEKEEDVFKTLVTIGTSGTHYVFMVPVNKELNLKKAAGAAGEKSLLMLKSSLLFELTGYVHGGCSPVGMKKSFRTIIDESATEKKEIFFSAGKIGVQFKMSPEELGKLIRLEYAHITGDE